MNLIAQLSRDAFYRNSIIFAAGTFSANAVNYLFRLVIGRLVSVENYGQIESLVSLFNIFSVFAIVFMLLFADMAARHKAQNLSEKSRRAFKVFIKSLVPFLAAAFVFLALISVPVKNYLGIDGLLPVLAVWISVLLTLLLGVVSGMLKGWQKFNRLAMGGIWGGAAKLIFGTAIILAGFQVFGAVISFAAGSAVSLVYTLHFLKKDIFGKTSAQETGNVPENAILKALGGNYKKIMIYFAAVMSIAIFANADMIAAKHNLSAYYASGFGALSLSSKIIFFACSSITLVFFAHSAEQFYKKSRETAIFRKALVLISLIALLMTIFYFLLPKFILWMIYGGKYSYFSNYLGYFAATSFLLSVNNFLVHHAISNGLGGVAAILLVISIIFFLACAMLGGSIVSLLAITAFFQVIAIIFQLFLISMKKNATI